MKNKKIVLLTALAISLSFAFTLNFGTSFCEGWKDGHCEGWKDIKGQYSVCPIAPICPIPAIGQDTYRGGYNAGFKAGRRAAYNN
ncbi:MAG: hypothetical protein V3S79_00970 [Candidatus Thermoplasmatota archaeon]